jgi:hypothetical protein
MVSMSRMRGASVRAARAVGGSARDGDRRPVTHDGSAAVYASPPSAGPPNALGVTLLLFVSSMPATQSGPWLPRLLERARSMVK